jgi:hypothetical protein
LRNAPSMRIFNRAMLTAEAIGVSALLVVLVGFAFRHHARAAARINVGPVSERWLTTHRMEDP